ncbi:Frag1/DRAM/Sfk1 family-domain-containing protein [Mariannaea sp. PMI_226]|nr:Frag1/DRAM/Sfk1 family-domain-containing protein [Mariannaea sp. PMI_226]
MAFRGKISYWVLPIISGLVWLGMLLGLLLWWIVQDHSRRLPTMSEHATIAYISNIGADKLWPLFIAGCVITAIFLDLAFISERWLRHNGRLVLNTSTGEKVLSILSLVAAAVGTVGLVCLSIFRTGYHSKLHWLFLALFIVGYLVSAIFLCWEYQRLGIKNREHSHLRLSFWIKLIFILLELALLIGFGVCSRKQQKNAAAVLEWTISFIFSFYVFSFVIDLYPAVHTREPAARFTKKVHDRERVESFSNASSYNNISIMGYNNNNNYYQRDVEMS